MPDIKITTLRCGSISLRPYDADIRGSKSPFQRIRLPVNVFLIQHPVHGSILFDTGLCADVGKLLPPHLKAFYKPEISPGESAAEQLAAMGIRPGDIDLVLLSHLDIDHTCALGDFAGRAKRMVCAELEYFYSCRYVYKARQVWDTWLPYLEKCERDRLPYHGSALGPVGRGFDLFGDDSFICIYCPGHTDGIFTLIVSQSPSNRFSGHGDGCYGGEFAVLASDVAFSQKNIDDLSIPGYGFDRKQQKNALEFLKKLQGDPMHKATLLSHEAPKENTVILK